MLECFTSLEDQSDISLMNNILSTFRSAVVHLNHSLFSLNFVINLLMFSYAVNGVEIGISVFIVTSYSSWISSILSFISQTAFQGSLSFLGLTFLISNIFTFFSPKQKFSVMNMSVGYFISIVHQCSDTPLFFDV